MAQMLDEASVDLDLVDVEAAKIAERRITGSEVIKRNAKAGSA